MSRFCNLTAIFYEVPNCTLAYRYNGTIFCIFTGEKLKPAPTTKTSRTAAKAAAGTPCSEPTKPAASLPAQTPHCSQCSHLAHFGHAATHQPSPSTHARALSLAKKLSAKNHN